jgi:hypothetical protein
MNLNFIWVNPKENEKIYYFSGPHCSPWPQWSTGSRPTVVSFGGPCHPVHGQSTLGARSPRGAWPAHAVLNGATTAYQRWGLRLDLLHKSLYEPRQQDLDEVAGSVVLTSEVVEAAAADDVEGGKNSKVGEGAPSSAPELHMSDADIRPCLINDEKWRSESSPAVAEVTRVIRNGGRGSGPMILKPRAKGAQGSEDHLYKRNCPMTGPISG